MYNKFVIIWFSNNLIIYRLLLLPNVKFEHSHQHKYGSRYLYK